MAMQFLPLFVLCLSLCRCCTCFLLSAWGPTAPWEIVSMPADGTSSSATVGVRVQRPSFLWHMSIPSRRLCLQPFAASLAPLRDTNSEIGFPGVSGPDSGVLCTGIPPLPTASISTDPRISAAEGAPTGVSAHDAAARSALEAPAVEASAEKDKARAGASTGPVGDLECIEIDASVEGISREALLQLLQEMHQQMPELYDRLSLSKPSALEAVPTQQLRQLLQQLLDLAEAADAEDAAAPPGAGTGLRTVERQPQEEQKSSLDQHQHHLSERDQDSPGSERQQHQGPIESADAAATAAVSAAAAEAQDLLELGMTEEAGNGLFAALQEELPQMTDADVWELLVTMGSVLEALLFPERLQTQQHRHQHQQDADSVDSLDQFLVLSGAERKALATEEEALCKLVEKAAAPLSSKGRKELLLTLFAVVEAEDYCPTDSQVRLLLRLDPPVDDGAISAPSGDAQIPQAVDRRGIGGPPMIAAWRQLLQQPENAPAGGTPLSPAEAAALSDEEIRQRFANLLLQARGEGIRASFERLQSAESPPGGPSEGLAPQLTSQSLDVHHNPQKALQSEPPGGGKPPGRKRALEVVDPQTQRGVCPERPSLERPLESAPSMAPAGSQVRPVSAKLDNPMTAQTPYHKQSRSASTAGVTANATSLVGPDEADAKTPPAVEAGNLNEPDPTRLPPQGSSPQRAQKLAAIEQTTQNVSGFAASPLGGLVDASKGSSLFASLGLSQAASSAAEAVLGGTASKPTDTQRLAVPVILSALRDSQGKHRRPKPTGERASAPAEIDRLVALRAQTGTGKTLAFLLPLMQMLREQDEQEGAARAAADARQSTTNAGNCADLLDCSALAEALRCVRGSRTASGASKGPRALIVCPSRPLAAQVASAATLLARRLGLSVACATGGVGSGTQRRILLRRPVDILIGTPDRLLHLTRPLHGEDAEIQRGEKGNASKGVQTLASLANLQFCVLDEVDALWLGGFRGEVEKLLSRSRFLMTGQGHDQKQEAKRMGPRVLITCTATPDSGVEAEIRERLKLPVEKYLPVSGGRTFPPLGHLRHEMMQVLGEDRFMLLREQLRIQPELRGKKVLVFCNTVSSCRACCHHLQAAGLPAEGYDGSLPASIRERNLRTFQEGEGQKILVATDAVARGLHIKGVDAVVNADFPLTAVEYLHRAGRTGRAGSKGFVFSLVAKRDAAVAAAVRTSLSAGVSLDGLKQRPGEVNGDGGARCSKKSAGHRNKGGLAKVGSKTRRGGWKPPKSPEWHASRSAINTARRLRRRNDESVHSISRSHESRRPKHKT